MRLRRLSLVAGWSMIALLAVGGFAAFRDTGVGSQQAQADPVTAAMGHTAGAYAGLVFAWLDGDQSETQLAVTPGASEDLDSMFFPDPRGGEVDLAGEQQGQGTIASPITGWLSQVEVRALVGDHFEPQDVNRAIRVAWCESRFDPNSVDLRTGGVGLFHHLPRYWPDRAASAGFPDADPTDPEASVAAAAWEVYHGGGWDVFGCRG